MKKQKTPFYSVEYKSKDGAVVSYEVYFGDIVGWEIKDLKYPLITIYTPIVKGGHKIIGISNEEDGAEFYYDWCEFKTKNNS